MFGEPQVQARLIALLRRFQLDHAKSATRSVCLCPICVDTRRLLERLEAPATRQSSAFGGIF